MIGDETILDFGVQTFMMFPFKKDGNALDSRLIERPFETEDLAISAGQQYVAEHGGTFAVGKVISKN